MDVGSLLAQVDAEIFEPEREDFISPSVTANPQNQHQSVNEILNSAAQEVILEEKRITDKAFNEVNEELLQDNISSTPSDRLVSSFEIAEEVTTLQNREQSTVNLGRKDSEILDQDDYSSEEKDQFEVETKEPEEPDDGEEDSDREETDEALDKQLILACARPNYDAAINALKSGAYLFCRDRHGWTALHWAASKGSSDLVNLLLEKRRNSGKKMKPFVNATDSLAGWTPLHVSYSSTFLSTYLHSKRRNQIINELGGLHKWTFRNCEATSCQ